MAQIGPDIQADRQREPRAVRAFPRWLRKRIPASGQAELVRQVLADLRVATVCGSARCPNLCECFAAGTATFMILGETCTRGCAFCAVRRGAPLPPEPDEPERVAEAAARLTLRYIVVTSVTRDDLADGGAEHFRRTICACRRRLAAPVEVLTPDFRGDMHSVDAVAAARPEVYNHNVETVPRLYPAIRPQADYRRSLSLLEYVKSRQPMVYTKSGLMVGLGETRREVVQVMRDLRAVGCDLLTIGQYLQPSPAHAPVARFVPPQAFRELRREGERMGFAAVAAGPFVRSSYRASLLRESGANAPRRGTA